MLLCKKCEYCRIASESGYGYLFCSAAVLGECELERCGGCGRRGGRPQEDLPLFQREAGAIDRQRKR